MTKEALTLALEALAQLKGELHEEIYVNGLMGAIDKPIAAIKEALAQQSNISELKEKTANHNVDCLCADCSMLDDLEDATAQPEQNLVTYSHEQMKFIAQANYDAGYQTKKQEKREFVGLTEDEVESCFHHVDEAGIGLFDFADAIEAKLKEKNT